MVCNNCSNEEATFKAGIGYLPCRSCSDRAAQFPKPKIPVEFTTEAIKEARVGHAAETTQPFRDGKLSQEYLDIYGTKSIIASDEDIRKAEYVWPETVYYKQHK